MALNGKRSLHSLNGKCAQQTFLVRSREMQGIHSRLKLEFKQMRARLAKIPKAGEYLAYFPVLGIERNAAIAA